MMFLIAVMAALSQSPQPESGVAAPPAPRFAQAEGAFPGTLACEAGSGVAADRVAVSVTIEGGRASYTFPASGGAGASETGGGLLGANRQLVLTGSAKGKGVSYQSRYAGEVGGRGGTLTGTQSGSAAGRSFTRRCQLSLGNGRG